MRTMPEANTPGIHNWIGQMKMKTSFKQCLICLLMLLVTACGGGSSGGGNSSLVSSGPGTGTGGTGIAVISGFSSIILNNDRVFNVDSSTQLFIDDNPVTLTQLQTQGSGLVAHYDVAEDVNANISSGTLITLHAGNTVIGPVTSLTPFQVFGQTVTVTGDTVLVGVPGGSPDSLAIGDIVEVSGFDNDNNVILATRIQHQPAGVAVWKIRGHVGNVATDSFSLGTQQISLNGVVPDNCGANLTNRDRVEVTATPSPVFTAGTSLDTVIEIRCTSYALNLPANAAGAVIKAEVEGFVTAFNSINDFSMHEQRVVTTPGTVYEGGRALDIVSGVRLEAEGVLDIMTGILTAEKIRFRQTRVEITAPLDIPPGGLKASGGSFTVLDVITVNLTALTEDPDGLISGSGVSGLVQVEIDGYQDGSNQIFADSVELESSVADANEIELRGPVSNPVNPLFELLGVTVDTTGSVIFDQDGSQQITPTEFFNKVTPGVPVEVEDAVFTPGPPPTLSGGVIEIED